MERLLGRRAPLLDGTVSGSLLTAGRDGNACGRRTLWRVTFSSDAAARQQLLDELGDAADRIGTALALLGDAYEQLDEHAADRLEEALFRPVQLAYGRARRTHTEFSERRGFSPRRFEPSASGRPAGARAAIQGAVDDVRFADDALSALQDSMLPVEYGDAELRAGLSGVRELIAPLSGRARELIRTLGR
jgi:hypothetical protein